MKKNWKRLKLEDFEKEIEKLSWKELWKLREEMDCMVLDKRELSVKKIYLIKEITKRRIQKEKIKGES